MTPETAGFASRLDGYRRRLRHECSMWRANRRSRRNFRYYEAWLDTLHRTQPEVMLGPDFTAGGVRGHVHAIRHHSALRIGLVPDATVIGGLERFTAEVRERFYHYDAPPGTVVHSHVLPWMIRWCRRQQERGLRWVHTYHNMYFPEFARGELEPWQREVNEALIHEARHADVRLSVSRWQQTYLRDTHGIETHYLPNGVDVEACDRGDAGRFRRRHGLSGPFILFVGRNDPVKNPADFVRLATALGGHNFVMLGEGLAAEVLRNDWAVDVPPNLRVLGAADHAGVQDALAACAALVVTSKREGLPTVVLEAMAHRKPIVVPREAGCVETVGGGEFGRIYQPGDLGDLVRQTQAALAESDRRDAARERVLAEYDWRVVAGKLDAIYQTGRIES
jgi:glycosyltransferase involved in cell wall biosynthesis